MTATKSEQQTLTSNAGLSSPWWLGMAALVPCVASFFFATSPASQAPLTVTRSRPALLFATYMYHHGDAPVELEPTLESEFRFRNEGTEPVIIGEIERSCGCMSPRLTQTEIAPGEVGSLLVPIQTINQSPGPHEYTVTVNYKDPEPRRTTLSIKAIFPEKMVVVQPKALYLSQRSGKSVPFHVAVSDFREKPLMVTDVMSTAPFVSTQIDVNATPKIVQVSHQEQAPGSKTDISGEVSGNIPPGRHHVLITASTSDTEFPVVVVPMIINGPAYPEGQAAIASPSQFRLIASDDPSAKRRARIQVVMPSSWQISHATAWPEELTVEYTDCGDISEQEKMMLVDVELSALPASKVTDGIVQLFANDGKNLVTTKATLIWP